MNIKRVKWSYLNIKKQKLEYRAELQRIKDSREVIPDPMRSEESMKLIDNPVNCNPKKSKEMEKLIEEIFKKCNGNLL